MSSTSTSTSTTTDSTISPEILFLVKQQAKAIAQINILQKKVDQLEKTIKCHNKKSENECTHRDSLRLNCASSSSTKKSVTNNSSNSKEQIAISDDSGGEFSQLTTTSEEDELSLLLDQIAIRSQQTQRSHQISSHFSNLSINSIISGNHKTDELLSQMRTKRQYNGPTPQSVLKSPNLQFHNTSSSKQLERTKTLVKHREEREVDKQIKLNEEWLQTQLRADPKRYQRDNW